MRKLIDPVLLDVQFVKTQMSHKLVSGSEHNFMNYPGSEHEMKIWSISFFKYTRNTILNIYGMEGIRDGEDINNAVRPLLQEYAKQCYLAWLYIDNNDGELPDDLKSFDNLKKFTHDFHICRKLSSEDMPKSGIPYSCICTEWRGHQKN
ncbi:unnamed protein product [Bathycoccus prasinos]